MASDPDVNLFLCFDANLPKLERCEPDCDIKGNILCLHRFEPKVQILYISGNKFWRWSDRRVVTYFFGEIITGIAEKKLNPKECLFMILTKDRNFIDDVRQGMPTMPLFIFSNNSISCGGITVFIKQIDCQNYGNKRADDLKCSFEIVNNFFNTITI